MASFSNGLTGAADENANVARVSAAVERLRVCRAAATAGADAAEAVRVSADHLTNEGLRNAGAAEQGRDPQFPLVPERFPAWVSAGQPLFRPKITPALQQELQQFNSANPGVAPPIIPGQVFYLLPRVSTSGKIWPIPVMRCLQAVPATGSTWNFGAPSSGICSTKRPLGSRSRRRQLRVARA